MNVLILTPDAVGSTLLQRMITIQMQCAEYNQPVVNLHELTLGIIRYWNPELNCYMLGRDPDVRHQALLEITETLASVDHYKTCRVAHYHIKRRGDSIEDQVPFYRFLNDNFFIIACRRQNIFEHALSLCLSKIHKNLNVYS